MYEFFKIENHQIYINQNSEIKSMIPYEIYSNINGYKCLKIFDNNRYYTFTIHRIIAKLFIKNSNENNTIVDHIDRNR